MSSKIKIMDLSETLTAYRLMLTSRVIDDRCQELVVDGGFVPNYHSGRGQEALSVALGFAPERRDYLLYTYRDFGALLAKGVTITELVADLLLKVTGTTKGFGGIMHVVAPQHGIVGRNGVFGSRFGIAIGLALASVRLNEDRVVVCAFGEAEASRGPLYEALNMACLGNLPVLFVAQNNGFAIAARTQDMFASGDMSGMWQGAPLPVTTVDGNEWEAVYQAVEVGLRHCRDGLGPYFLEAFTYRIDAHFPDDDDSRYRTVQEVDEWRAKDPITCCEVAFLEQGILDDDGIKRVRAEVEDSVNAAIAEATAAAEPNVDALYTYVYRSFGVETAQ